MKIYAVEISESQERWINPIDGYVIDDRIVGYYKKLESAEKICNELNDVFNEYDDKKWKTGAKRFQKKYGIFIDPERYIPDSALVIKIDVQED